MAYNVGDDVSTIVVGKITRIEKFGEETVYTITGLGGVLAEYAAYVREGDIYRIKKGDSETEK